MEKNMLKEKSSKLPIWVVLPVTKRLFYTNR
jgi:hypothetical protein